MLIYSFITDYQAFNLRYKDNTARDKNETKVGKQSANLGKNNEPIQNQLSFLIDCKSVILHHLTILSFPMVRPAWDNWRITQRKYIFLQIKKEYMIMKRTLWFIFFLLNSLFYLYADSENDSLLKVLDKVISERLIYTQKKEATIKELKKKKVGLNSLEDIYNLNKEIIHQYETFVCDSAEQYIHENIDIAKTIGNKEYLLEERLRLAFVYSLSGLFIQANDIFKSIKCADLPDHLKALYCWNRIRYYENLIKYTDDVRFSNEYISEKEAYRDTVMSILFDQSDEYRKEKAVKLQDKGSTKEALLILTEIYDKQEPASHGYAMMAMGLARAYRLIGNYALEEKFLMLAAMTDTKLAVKENEALLTLAVNLYHKGDIDRAYNYIKVALDDAIFYNSRFKNTVIARIHPIIENTYLIRLEKQKQNLRFYIFLTSLFVVALAITLYFTYKQTKIVSRAKRHLKAMNEELVGLNKNLDEANLIKEKYVGYFMNQCAVYINKLDEYRKNVNRKIKTGQIDDLYKSSSRPFEKELEELYHNFDKAFLNLYPNFVEKFNSLLKPEERYKLEKDQLNTELRIFALIRLGITDVGQIAVFLHYSVQTIYNYKSKVKRMSTLDSNIFEEEVKKLGSLSQK